jgi:secreted trypsin-like serine protease
LIFNGLKIKFFFVHNGEIMRKIFNLFLITTAGAVFLYSCGKAEKESLRTPNKCDVSLLSANQNNNRIFDGCEIDQKTLDAIPQSKATISISTSTGNCTGTFIGNNTIITAAHCFNINNLKGSEEDIQKETNAVYINSSDIHEVPPINSKENPNLFLTKVTSIKIHPYFLHYCQSGNGQVTAFNLCNFGDLALLKTEKSAAEINSTITKITSDIKNNEKVLFIGYGRMNDNDTPKSRTKRWGISYLYNPDLLQFSLIPIVLPDQTSIPLGEFYKTYLYDYILPQYHDDPRKSFLFTRGLENENGICQGDSGGAVFVKRGSEFVAAGVVHANTGSTTEICKSKQSADMRIGAYLKWIRDETTANGDNLIEY